MWPSRDSYAYNAVKFIGHLEPGNHTASISFRCSSSSGGSKRRSPCVAHRAAGSTMHPSISLTSLQGLERVADGFSSGCALRFH